MATDVIQKVLSGNSIRYGDATVATGAKRGATQSQSTTDGIVYSGLDTTLEARLTDRFDDPTYYTA